MIEEKKAKLPIFAERFNALRGERTQAEFAEFLGISRPTVGFYENGERIPDALVLSQIAKQCGVTTDYLAGLSDNKTLDGANVAKATGLSDKAINVLEMACKKKKHYKKHNDYQKYYWMDVLNFLIESFDYFPDFADTFECLINLDVTKESIDMEQMIFNKDEDLFNEIYSRGTVVSGSEYKKYLIQDITEIFSNILRTISEKTNPTESEFNARQEGVINGNR